MITATQNQHEHWLRISCPVRHVWSYVIGECLCRPGACVGYRWSAIAAAVSLPGRSPKISKYSGNAHVSPLHRKTTPTLLASS